MSFLLIFALLIAQTAAQTPAPGPNPSEINAKPPEKGSIEGKVVNAVTGEPLKKAHVLLQGSTQESAGATFSVLTDTSGAFVLKDIDSGTYRLNADRTGFARSAYGAKKAAGGGTDLKLSPGQALKDVAVKLQPQAVVAGRITDSDGEPVANVSVAVTRSVYTNGQRE